MSFDTEKITASVTDIIKQYPVRFNIHSGSIVFLPPIRTLPKINHYQLIVAITKQELRVSLYLHQDFYSDGSQVLMRFCRYARSPIYVMGQTTDISRKPAYGTIHCPDQATAVNIFEKIKEEYESHDV